MKFQVQEVNQATRRRLAAKDPDLDCNTEMDITFDSHLELMQTARRPMANHKYKALIQELLIGKRAPVKIRAWVGQQLMYALFVYAPAHHPDTVITEELLRQLSYDQVKV